MKFQNRILVFFSIGFVLVFFGKISKVDLYTNFFQQIQEVEIRNTQQVADTALPATLSPESQAKATESPERNNLFKALLPKSFQARIQEFKDGCKQFVRDHIHLPDLFSLLTYFPSAP